MQCDSKQIPGQKTLESSDAYKYMSVNRLMICLGNVLSCVPMKRKCCHFDEILTTNNNLLPRPVLLNFVNYSLGTNCNKMLSNCKTSFKITFQNNVCKTSAIIFRSHWLMWRHCNDNMISVSRMVTLCDSIVIFESAWWLLVGARTSATIVMTQPGHRISGEPNIIKTAPHVYT